MKTGMEVKFKKRKYYPDKRIGTRDRSTPKEKQGLQGRKGTYVIGEQLVEETLRYIPELVAQTKESCLHPNLGCAGAKEINGSEIIAFRASQSSTKRNYRSTVRRWYAIRSGENRLTDFGFADEIFLACEDPYGLTRMHCFPSKYCEAVEMADAYFECLNENTDETDVEMLACEMMLVSHRINEKQLGIKCSKHCFRAIGGEPSRWLTPTGQ